MPVEPSRLDITKLKGFSVEVKSHDLPEILASRLRQEEADAAHQRRKDLALFWAAILGVFCVGAACLYVALSPKSGPDDKKWATSALFSIVTGAVGFLAGKNSK